MSAGDGTVTWAEIARGAVAGGLAEHEVRWLVEEAAGIEPGEWDTLVTVRRLRTFEELARRRAAGEPLQYVLGRWAFRRLDLFVDRRVLIPRAETEVVAGVALEALAAAGGAAPAAVDLGTGSGAIGLSLVVEHPSVRVVGTDVDEAALAVARANAAGVGTPATRLTLRAGSWYEALPGELAGQLDVIVSNPPYVGDDEALPAEVERWEPAHALRSGPDGLDAVRTVVAGAPGWLAPGGTVVVEIAPTQAAAASELAAEAGLADVHVRPDLAGRDRVLVARRPPA